MEPLEPTFTLAKLVLITIVLVALLCAHFISATERRLVAGTALVLAGMFFLVRSAEPITFASGLATAAFGAVIVVRAGLAWDENAPTPMGAVAGLILLPAAFFGAIMLTGVILSFLVAPVRLVLRLLGG